MTRLLDIQSEAGAKFSPCRKYRYSLWRKWSDENRGYAMFIGLNPSTADETRNDPTVRRCIGYAKDWGYSGLIMTNIFGYRATLPAALKAVNEPIGAGNDRALRTLAATAAVVVAAWGVHGVHLNRHEKVRKMLPQLKVLRLTKAGHPCHPLYLPKTLSPICWNPQK